MEFGGPVWHASTAPHGFSLGEAPLRRAAYKALTGVGDPGAGEWVEYTGKAFHLRRRLSAGEQRHVGEVVDVRGTPEGERRLAVVMRERPEIPEAALRSAG